MHADDKYDHRGHRSINAGIGLKVPANVVHAKCAPYLHRGKPVRRTERIVDTDFSIVAQFQSEYRGVAEYYRLAFNRHKLGRLKYVMERSLTKTLARKYRISVPQVYRRYRAVLDTGHGPRRGLRVTVDRDGKPPLVAQWGGISLARDTTPRPLNDDPARIWSHRSQIVQRLMADECELCGSRTQVEVHHIRGTQRPQPQEEGQPARLGQADGSTPPQDPRRLPRIPRGHPQRKPSTATTMSTGEPRCSENEQVRFGGRPLEKGHYGTSLAAHPTSSTDLWGPDAEMPQVTRPESTRSMCRGRVLGSLPREDPREIPDVSWSGFSVTSAARSVLGEQPAAGLLDDAASPAAPDDGRSKGVRRWR